jgi:hypothetical protein
MLKILDVAAALGMDMALESLLWWGFLYFLVVHVLMGLLGEVVRTAIKTLARTIGQGIAGWFRRKEPQGYRRERRFI